MSCVFWDACQWTQWGAEKSVEQWKQPGYILIMPSETITGSVAPFRAAMPFSADLAFSDIMWNASSIKWKWSVMVECFSLTETLEKQTESFPDTETRFCKVNDHLTKKNHRWFSCAPHKTKNSSLTDYIWTHRNRLFLWTGNKKGPETLLQQIVSERKHFTFFSLHKINLVVLKIVLKSAWN